MKRVFTLLFSAFMFHVVPAATPDSTMLLTWNPNSLQWDTTQIYKETYAAGKLVRVEGKLYNAGVPAYAHTWTYNASGQVIYRFEDAVTPADIQTQEFTTYNVQGMRISKRIEVNLGNGTFDTIAWDSMAITLDGSNRGIVYDHYAWDKVSRNFKFISRMLASDFGTDNFPQTLQQLQPKSPGIFDSIIMFSDIRHQGYIGPDIMGAPFSDFTISNYDKGSGDWKKVQRKISLFSGGKPERIWELNWDAINSEWDTLGQNEYYYDAQGNQTEYRSLLWHPSTLSYHLNRAQKDSFVYDTDNNVLEQITMNHNFTLGRYENTEWRKHFYPWPAGLNDIQNIKGGFYPNPATISVFIENREGQHLQIMDIEGKVLYKTIVSDNYFEVQLDNFSKGLLLLQFTANNGKIAVEKLLHQ